jgi:hypothetical protein
VSRILGGGEGLLSRLLGKSWGKGENPRETEYNGHGESSNDLFPIKLTKI